MEHYQRRLGHPLVCWWPVSLAQRYSYSTASVQSPPHLTAHTRRTIRSALSASWLLVHRSYHGKYYSSEIPVVHLNGVTALKPYHFSVLKDITAIKPYHLSVLKSITALKPYHSSVLNGVTALNPIIHQFWMVLQLWTLSFISSEWCYSSETYYSSVLNGVTALKPYHSSVLNDSYFMPRTDPLKNIDWKHPGQLQAKDHLRTCYTLALWT